jgi:hypothetical protein
MSAHIIMAVQVHEGLMRVSRRNNTLTCSPVTFSQYLIVFLLVTQHQRIDATPSAVASFSDARCTAGGVCPNDPLVFTCEVNNAVSLRVILPTGYREHVSVGDTTNNVALPAGFKADSLVITPIDDFRRNFTLTLSIENASLLNGGLIRCYEYGNRAMAGCPLAGSPAAPSHLVHVKSSNTLTTATITWESVGNDVSYTVNSTSAGAPFSGITQTSYTLRDLEVGTDYVVSVTATNECGIESPPSEEITVRIDLKDTCKSEGEVLSAGAVAGIAVTVTLLLALPVGVVIGLGVAWYGMRRGQGPMYT